MEDIPKPAEASELKMNMQPEAHSFHRSVDEAYSTLPSGIKFRMQTKLDSHISKRRLVECFDHLSLDGSRKLPEPDVTKFLGDRGGVMTLKSRDLGEDSMFDENERAPSVREGSLLCKRYYEFLSEQSDNESSYESSEP